MESPKGYNAWKTARRTLHLKPSKVGLAVALVPFHRFFVRHGITREKTGCAIEQHRLDILRQRQAWFEEQMDKDGECLLSIEETWNAASLTNSDRRCARVQRLHIGLAHEHRKTTILVTGSPMSGVVVPKVRDGLFNDDWFETYPTEMLIPQ